MSLVLLRREEQTEREREIHKRGLGERERDCASVYRLASLWKDNLCSYIYIYIYIYIYSVCICHIMYNIYI